MEGLGATLPSTDFANVFFSDRTIQEANAHGADLLGLKVADVHACEATCGPQADANE